MKNVLTATAIAVLAVTAIVSTASAQATKGPNGRGNNNQDNSGRDHNPDWCIPGTAAGFNCRPRPVVAKEDQCECQVRKIRSGGRISYVQDCYFFDVKKNMERYCQPWERRASN